MRVAVTNTAHYRLGRAGYAFDPGETTVVYVSTSARLREIRACVYLRVRVVSDEEAAEIAAEQAAAAETLEESVADADGVAKDAVAPPKVGAGSGRAAWAVYAASIGITVTEDMGRAAIWAAVEAAVEVPPDGTEAEVDGTGEGEPTPEIEPRELQPGEKLEEAPGAEEIGPPADPPAPEPAAEEAAAAETLCDAKDCGFVAKTPLGLKAHKRAKHGG